MTFDFNTYAFDPSTLDRVTWYVFLSAFAIWALWEIVLVILRLRGRWDGTVSMVAKDKAFRASVLPYLWFGLGAHYFLWWEVKGWHPPYLLGIAFWAFAAGFLALDIALWKRPPGEIPRWLRIVRDPRLVALFGLVAGKMLFPQRGEPWF